MAPNESTPSNQCSVYSERFFARNFSSLKILHRRAGASAACFGHESPDPREVIDDARFHLADKAVARTILFLQQQLRPLHNSFWGPGQYLKSNRSSKGPKSKTRSRVKRKIRLSSTRPVKLSIIRF